MRRGIALPLLKPSEVRRHKVKDYFIRFCFGAAISLVAGIIGMKFGPKVGGVFLAFPAILPASLTLIQQESGKEEAAIDSEGAILGALAMVVFAIVTFLAVVKLGVAVTLFLALALWLVIAVGLYAAIQLFLQVRKSNRPQIT
jgi:hypothetical protein